MNKEILLENYKAEDKIEFLEFLKNFYFTYSELKDIIEMLNDIKDVKNINLKELLLILDIKLTGNNKKNAQLFIKKIKNYRYPIITESLDKQDFILNKIKRKNFKIIMPQNFEGDNLKIELNLKKDKDLKELLEHLRENSEYITELLTMLKRGG